MSNSKAIKKIKGVKVEFDRKHYSANELRELLVLIENQETTDKYINTSIRINGDFALIDVDIDEFGNIKIY